MPEIIEYFYKHLDSALHRGLLVASYRELHINYRLKCRRNSDIKNSESLEGNTSHEDDVERR